MDTFWVWLPVFVLVSVLVMMSYCVVIVIERLGWFGWADQEWDLGYDAGHADGAMTSFTEGYEIGYVDGAMAAFADERKRAQS